ncbi:MAG: LLM class flavin-dependent oxidoreductase [Promethearchaeota archaeon]
MSKIKFGIDMSIFKDTKSWKSYKEFIEAINEDIWDGIWVGDHLGGLPPSFSFQNYNVWALFPVYAEMKSKAELGLAVTDPHRYLPQIVAQICVTIDHISNGRFIYGIGPGEAFNLDNYGIEKNKPVSKMEEYIEVLRKLWKSNGDRVSFSGDFYKFQEAILQPSPLKGNIPVWVAANGSRTRKLTGRIGDGWLPYSFNSKIYKIEMEEVKIGLSKSKRKLEDFTFGYWNFIYIDDDENTLAELTAGRKRSLAIYSPYHLKTLGYWNEEMQELYQKLGYNPETSPLPKLSSYDNYDFDIINQIVKDIPDSFIRDSSLIGPKEEIIAKLENLIKAGVQYFVLMISNPLEDKNSKYNWEYANQLMCEEIIPYLKENY